MKEQILKEFDNITIDGEIHPNFMGKDVRDMFERCIDKAISQTREETIREVEESLPKAQKITQKDWLGLDYTLGDVKYREHAYRLLVLDILNKLKK